MLSAFAAVGVPETYRSLRRGVGFLERVQNDDGGWGEDDRSYVRDYSGYAHSPSTASQTAWALIGLMAAGRVGGRSVARGIAYLRRTQGADGFWAEDRYTAVGFPRVFYLRYDGYPKVFPLMALARYHALTTSRTTNVPHGF